MSDFIFHCSLYLSGVFISAIAQLMLKKSATKKATHNIFTFMNSHFPALTEKLRNSKSKIWKLVKKYKKLLIEYLNPFTLTSYMIFVVATFLTIFSYKVVPLSMAPILGTSEYFFVAALSRIFLKEKINWKKALGLGIIVVGILVYSL